MTETTTRPYWEPRNITRDDFAPVDQAAIDLAIDLVLTEEPEMASIIRDSIAEGDWWLGAMHAVWHRQAEHLQLDNESPPCAIDANEIDDIIARGPIDNTDYGGALLLKKMLAAGLSKYDPRPIDSLAAADRRKKR